MDQPTDASAATVEYRPLTEGPGTRIGPYKLLQKIGEGGFGIVYMAEQEEPVRRLVAVKIIKPGMDTGQVIARFESERQALALMDHPHIARVLDAGATDSGRPYFVMELVKGVPITEFCDQNHMPAEARLKLFIDVCHAIQHAHHKGVIHRDIKPSNVMVTLHDGVPVVKVIDFGVAKATVQRLTEKTLFTAYGQLIGTPAYMSPEQAEMSGLDIDTRSDIYSLGVLLYELLTGTTPLDRKRLREAGYGEMQRMIREEEAPRPSTRLSSLGDSATILAGNRGTDVRRLARLLAGDLDWIAMKALEKDRNRRYGTPANFAEDIERYLRREAILARPPSTPYKVRKFIRRHRGPVIAASLLLVALVAGFAGTTWGLIRAELNARAADQARSDAENRARAEERAKNLAQAATKRAEQEQQRADDKAREARQALFAARQQVAMNAWRENRADVLADVLQRQRPAAGDDDLRGFEWSYLDRLSRAPGRRWQERGEMINGVAISPDDRMAITVGFDGKATAWDVATGQKKWDTGAGFRWSVNAAAIAPDGQSIALAGHLGQLQLWNVDGTFRQKLEGHYTQVFGVAFSPDGRWLASASADTTVRLWEVATGSAAGMLGAPPAADGLPGPRAIAQTNPTAGIGHTNMVWQAAWAPDSKRLASCSTDGSIKIWEIPEGKLLHTLVGHEGVVIAVAWSPDGRLIAGASRPLFGSGNGEVKLWNPETGRAEATFRPPTGGLHAIAFTPDGLFVVTGGQDHTVRVWRKDGRQVAEHRGLRSDVIGLAIGGGGRWAVAGTSAGEIVALELDALPGQQSVAAGDRTRLAFSTDGRLAAYRHGEVHWHDPKTLAKISTWPSANVAAKEGDRIFVDTVPVGFALRSDGEAAHSAHYFVGPGTVVWRDSTGKVRHLLTGHEAPITAVAFLPNDQLASADEAGAIRIWDGVSGKAMVSVQAWDGPVRFLTATDEGILWAGGASWAPGSNPDKLNRPTSKEGRYLRIERGAIAWNSNSPSVPLAADLSPDGRTLVVGHDDGTLRWLDPRTGAEIRGRTSATGPVVAVQFSPHEPRLAVGSADGTVRLMSVDSGEELLVLEGCPAPAASLAFYPDGRRIAAAGATMRGGAIIVWDGRPASDPGPLPAPDAVWHKARLADAADSSQIRYGPSSKDVFAMRRHLERLAALEPDDLQWPRGLLALDQDAGDYRAAATRLDEIVRRWPNDAPMWYDLGNARRELGEVADAKAAFRKCIALDPNFAEAHCNLGLILSREGKHEEAVEPLARGHQLGMAKISNNQAWSYPSAAWLAATYAALDRQADILQLFESTLTVQKARLGPDHLDTLASMAHLADSLSNLGRSAEAVPLIDDFVQRAAGQRVHPNLVVNAIVVRLRHFQKQKDAAGCRTTAEMFERLKLNDVGSLYNAACLRAVTAAAIGESDKSETASQQATIEADRAMAWLRQAVAAGFADAANLATDKDLDGLRERADFQAVLAALKNSPKP